MKRKTLNYLDYKFGMIDIPAENNYQLLSYAFLFAENNKEIIKI